MNWIGEGHKSWEWLQWMREVVAEGTDPHGCLPHLIRGMAQWDEAIAHDRHSVGDPDLIDRSERFLFAASMMSRTAKEAIGDALKHAVVWAVDDPMTWPDEPEERQGWVAEARTHWSAAHHVVRTVLQAWIMLWNDLADQQSQVTGTFAQQLAQWKSLAEQASEIVSGAIIAAWAQAA